MIGLLQRVSSAAVEIAGTPVAAIDEGLLVLVGVQREDDAQRAERLVDRLLGYRVFPDHDGRMNLSLQDIAGGLLLVPQFTLAADTRKGTRAGFSGAAEPRLGRELFEHLVAVASQRHRQVASGVFGADMRVRLVNEGPVTFWLQA